MIPTEAVLWPPLLVALPLLAGAAGFVARSQAANLALLAGLAVPAVLAGLTGRVLVGGAVASPVGGWPAPLGIGLHADGLALLLLWTTALAGLCLTIYGRGYFPSAAGREVRERALLFWPLWLFLWAALNGLFLAADLFNIYVCLELLGLGAVALAALGGKMEARRAAMRYMLVNLLASAAYLFGVVLLYRELGTLDLAGMGRIGDGSLAVHAALAFILLALLVKAAVFPLHFWLPPAHANAPAPVSALLSGLVVKGAVYLLLRFWLHLGPLPAPALSQFLGALGGTAVLWGSLQALAAGSLKTLIAYSTVAQLGYLLLFFPLQGAADRFTVWSGILFLLVAHALAKAALFLAAGIVRRQTGDGRLEALTGISQTLPVTSLAFSLAAVSLMGLPPTGGFAAKWNLLHAAVAGGQWWWAAVIVLGSLLAAGYLFRPIALTFRQVNDHGDAQEVKQAMRGFVSGYRVPQIRENGLSAIPAELDKSLYARFSGRGSKHQVCGQAADKGDAMPCDRLLRLQAPAVMEWPAFALALAGILLGIFPGRLLPLLAAGMARFAGFGT